VNKRHTTTPFRMVHTEPFLWKPVPKPLPPCWVQFAQEQRAAMIDTLQRQYILHVLYDAEGVKELLHQWGLPWQVVMAGWLWECDLDSIEQAHLEEGEQIKLLIQKISKYVKYIEDDNLPALLIPPFYDLDALLIAVAIYYVALSHLSHEPEKARTFRAKIRRISTTLLNIIKRLGMWKIKREIEDLCAMILDPDQFAADYAEYMRLYEQDKDLLEELSRLFTIHAGQLLIRPMYVTYALCGVAGLQRRIQDAHTTITTQKKQLRGLDLVTFDILVPNVQTCYTAFGYFSHLGYVQDRVTDHIAHPKSNGYSYLAFGLKIDFNHPLMRSLHASNIAEPLICQFQIGTPLMQAIMAYGCLHPCCYTLYQHSYAEEELIVPSTRHFANSDDGMAAYAIKKAIAEEQRLWDNVRDDTDKKQRWSIIVYDRQSHEPVRMPKGATTLDFVYNKYPDFQGYNVKVIVNNRKVSVSRKLDAGDIIEVIVASDSNVTEANAVTDVARASINRQLEPDITIYERITDYIINRYYYPVTRAKLLNELQKLVEQYKLGSLAGYIGHLQKNIDRSGEDEKQYTIEWVGEQIMRQIADQESESEDWVPVETISPQRYFFPQQFCEHCQPTHPDKIIGVLHERSKTITIHQHDCHYLNNTRVQRQSCIALEWKRMPMFQVGLTIEARDRRGLLNDITKQLRYHQCILCSVNADVGESGTFAKIHLVMKTHDIQEVKEIKNKIQVVDNVNYVYLDRSRTPGRVYAKWESQMNQVEAPVEHRHRFITEVPEPRNIVLSNPFDISRPPDDKMFFGRKKELKLMQRDLCDSENGRAILLYGPRRSGKSSLCSMFLKRYVTPPMWSVHYSLQGDEVCTEEDILRKIIKEVTRAFRRQFHQSPPEWMDYDEEDAQARFRHLLEDCLALVPDSRLVLILDEFGGALTAFQQHRLEARFFKLWRDLFTNISQLSLVLVMPTNTYNVFSTHHISNTVSFARQVPLLFLDNESAEHLLTDTLRQQQIAVDIEVTRRALNLSGGNPYFMQLIGMYLVKMLNVNRSQQNVTVDDINEILKVIIQENAFNYFDFYHDEVQSEEEMQVLKNIVEITYMNSRDRVSLKNLSSRMHMPAQTLKPILDRMKSGLLLEEYAGSRMNPYYGFKVELVRQWMAEHQEFFM
jgi:guanosine-3',5'-bis(diphosphate) 3'-pyrophosphohydrolase